MDRGRWQSIWFSSTFILQYNNIMYSMERFLKGKCKTYNTLSAYKTRNEQYIQRYVLNGRIYS